MLLIFRDGNSVPVKAGITGSVTDSVTKKQYRGKVGIGIGHVEEVPEVPIVIPTLKSEQKTP